MKKNELKKEVGKLTNAQKAVLVSNVMSSYNIKIMPDKSVLSKLGKSGHTIYEAIAEFIDNAIDAMTDEQRLGLELLVINITLSVKQCYFSITDNGKGMDKPTLEKSATLGHSVKTADNLGFIGFGLKSGALTLADNYSVSTAVKGKNYRSEYEYNDVAFRTNPNWELPARDVAKDINEHGTTVTIKKVSNVKLTVNKTQHLKLDIAKRYRSFIEKKRVKILVNGIEVKVAKIEWIEGYPQNFSIMTKYGNITGKIGLMKESSQKGSLYGFDMFRNGRMIESYSKFAIGSHPTIARICGEVHLDFVRVSHEKNKFITETNEYEEAENACKTSEIFKAVVKAARDKNNEGIDKKETSIINLHVAESLPLLNIALKDLEYDVPFTAGKEKKVVPSKLGQFSKSLFSFLDVKKRGEYKKTENEPKEKKVYEKVKNVDVIEVNGQKFRVVHDFSNDKNGGRKTKDFDASKTTLYIWTNRAFAGYQAAKDKNEYVDNNILDAIIEYIYDDNKILLEEINEKKENLITKTLQLGDKFREAVKKHGGNIEDIDFTTSDDDITETNDEEDIV